MVTRKDKSISIVITSGIAVMSWFIYTVFVSKPGSSLTLIIMFILMSYILNKLVKYSKQRTMQKFNLTEQYLKKNNLNLGLFWEELNIALIYKKFPLYFATNKNIPSQDDIQEKIHLIDYLTTNGVKLTRNIFPCPLYSVKNKKLYVTSRFLTEFDTNQIKAVCGLFLDKPELYSILINNIQVDKKSFNITPLVGKNIKSFKIKVDSVDYIAYEELGFIYVLNLETLEIPDKETANKVIAKYKLVNS